MTDNKVLMERVELLLQGKLSTEQHPNVELTDCLIDEMYNETRKTK